MAEYGELTRVVDVRTRYLGSSQNGDDTLILDIIRQVSREIQDIANRHFWPLIDTHYYDTPRRDLYFDDDLLELTTLTNGDGNVITSADYKLYPLNTYPKNRLVLLSSNVWQNDSEGRPEGAITVAGVWGFCFRYSNMWQAIATLAAAITSASVVTFTTQTGKVFAGDLLKISNEYLYVSSVTTGATDTVTAVRGVNGSTAAAHDNGSAIERCVILPEVSGLATQATAMYYRLRSNPGLESYSMDGITFTTPRDVEKHMRTRLEGMGLVRLGLG